MNKTVKEIIFIVVLSVVSAVIYTLIFNNGYSLTYKSVSFKAGELINSNEAFSLSRLSDVLFIDARPIDDYIAGHIKGAVNLPLNSSRSQKMAYMQKIHKEQKIVVYCIDSGCPSAERLAGQLRFMGYNNVSIYTEGWLGWIDAGYPIEKGGRNE